MLYAGHLKILGEVSEHACYVAACHHLKNGILKKHPSMDLKGGVGGC
jgi:hypothetical protein